MQKTPRFATSGSLPCKFRSHSEQVMKANSQSAWSAGSTACSKKQFDTSGPLCFLVARALRETLQGWGDQRGMSNQSGPT